MEKIGKYELVRPIGTGGFGVVYEGFDPFLKRRVAVKTCTSEDREIRDRFFREAEIAGNLQHRHIVTVHDFGLHDGVPYLVQEYVPGDDLDALVARGEPATLDGKLDILLQIARGLAYAHAQGVIHRDIKPGNVRVTPEGTAKIMDFGIAKLANVASHLTRTGMALGTAAYLPPEQIRGAAVDHRADVFSFGVLACELLTGRRPFAGKTISALFFEIIHQEPPPPSALSEGCPASLDALVMRCLAKDPGGRYPGFEPILDELARLRRSGKSAPGRRTADRPARSAPPPATTDERPDRRPRTDDVIAAATELLTAPDRRGAPTPASSPVAQARSALQAGRVAEAERLLGTAGEDDRAADDLRRDLASARRDQVLARAAALREQGEPAKALTTLEGLASEDRARPEAEAIRRRCREDLAVLRRREELGRACQEIAADLVAGRTAAARLALGVALGRFGAEPRLLELERRLAAAAPQKTTAKVDPQSLRAAFERVRETGGAEAEPDLLRIARRWAPLAGGALLLLLLLAWLLTAIF